MCVHAKLLQLSYSETLWAVACQALLSMGNPQARILELVAMPSSRNLPDPEIEPVSLMSPALAGRFFTASAPWEALSCHRSGQF